MASKIVRIDATDSGGQVVTREFSGARAMGDARKFGRSIVATGGRASLLVVRNGLVTMCLDVGR